MIAFVRDCTYLHTYLKGQSIWKALFDGFFDLQTKKKQNKIEVNPRPRVGCLKIWLRPCQDHDWPAMSRPCCQDQICQDYVKTMLVKTMLDKTMFDKNMSRPWVTSYVKTMIDKTMLSRPNLSRLCQDHACQDHVCWDHVCQELVFKYHVMTNLIHSEPI